MSTSFSGTVQQVGERLFVRLPEKASGELPSRGQVAVQARVDGHDWSTVVEPDGRKGHWLAVDDQSGRGRPGLSGLLVATDLA